MSAIAAFIGRLLLALLFVLAGIPKIIDPSSAASLLEAANLPGSLAQPVGVFEVVAGLLLALGFMTRLVSILLFGFTLLTVFFFHNQFGDPLQAAQAIKNVAIAGGLLMVFAYGHMYWGYDRMRAQRKGERAAADAEARAHEAELRAARAEGRAEALGTRDRDGDGHPG
ncbi:DoxX family protein [Tsuneonella sp. YG55]|uniref:DoxX family protein n=1 Tax=Tsuneonella litorea TaxID=2976475 RepID=A0A9X2W3J3_9SPHN|nr:DoxX family protein [Tsuneonella litorea]MCT2559934.1 DoxX family protein [Tsuneonella litorea]